MKTALLYRRSRGPARASAQRGIVMLFGLIALAIMMIGAAAMVSSMNTAMLNAGNLGFKRDMTNQAERAVAAAVARLQVSGGLATEAARNASAAAENYSATILATTSQGLPNALVSDAGFAAVGAAANDIAVAAQGITMRYVIDRLCVNSGPVQTDHCSMESDASRAAGSESELVSAENPISAPGGGAAGGSAIPVRVLYRVSIRVTGPRNTQAFYQATLAL